MIEEPIKKLQNLLVDYSHDTFNYFSRIATQLSEETELRNVLKSPKFNVSKPILYVLYGTESKLVKVGRTKSSNNRLANYLATQGQPFTGNNFRTDDTIHLIGYYLLPNFDYDIQKYSQFMSDCEQLLIKNARQLFGNKVYGKEWFVSKSETYVMMSKLPKLFSNLTTILDDSMYDVLTSPLAIDKQKLLSISSDDDTYVDNIVARFFDMGTDNELFESEILTYELMFDLYQLFEKSETTSRMTRATFLKRIDKPMSTIGFVSSRSMDSKNYSDYTEKITPNRLSCLQFDKVTYANYLGIDLNDIVLKRERYFFNPSKQITPSELDVFEKQLTNMTIGDVDDLTPTERRMLHHFAYDKQNAYAQSLLGID